jgi:type III secretory pathway component EscT
VTGSSPILGTVVEAFEASGIDLSRLGLGWARVAPTVAIVPAFGLRALPTGARAVIGLALAAAIFPAVGPAHIEGVGSWPWLALEQVLLGLPVALAAAVPLWAATMAGGVADALRSTNETLEIDTVEGPATPLGALLSLLACAIFLGTGGPARVAMALAARPVGGHPLLAAAEDLASGISVAVAEVAGALVARAASPAQIHLLIAPLRAMTLLGVMAIVLDRVSGVMALFVEGAPR